MIFVKKYFHNLVGLLKSKSSLHFWLLVIMVFTPIIKKQLNSILYYLIVLFVLSFVVQSFFLIKKSYVLYIFRSIIITIIVFQIAWIEHDKKTSPMIIKSTNCVADSILGFKMAPNIQGGYYIKILNGDTLYHVSYSMDSLSRRVSENVFSTVNKTDTIIDKKHALFLGCSFTFGEGLNFSSTFPAIFEQQNPSYKSYNYGCPGSAPHQMALLFDEGINTINRSVIKESDGFALYTFIDDHLNRVYGSSLYFSWAEGLTPDVFIKNDSLMVKPRSKNQLFYADILNNLGLAKILGITLEYPHAEEFHKRFADIISYTAKKYWEINPKGDFMVGIYPGYVYDLAWTKYLDQRVKVLQIDTPPDFLQNPDKYKIKHDGHPTREFYAYYVEEITKLIVKNQ
jgi:hypothetical protein